MERDKVYLHHIIDAIHKIEKYIFGKTFQDFLKDTLVQDGVVRELEIIGEATKNLSTALKATHEGIPWQDIADMRNKLIHEYFGVDYITVWKVVKEDLPQLQEKIQSLL